jgi:hypothetical protein
MDARNRELLESAISFLGRACDSWTTLAVQLRRDGQEGRRGAG